MTKYRGIKVNVKVWFPGCSNFQAAINHEGGMFALKQ
jgi:hypothetical protein